MKSQKKVTFGDDRFLTEMGYSVSPSTVLKTLKTSKKFSIDFLDGKDTCDNIQLGKLLGEGKNGSVFEIPDDDNKGLPVVLKRFEVKKTFDIYKEADDGYDGPSNPPDGKHITYVLSSSLNEIAISSIFSSMYSGDNSSGNNPNNNYCINFPYFEGFFTCDNTGYVITEQLVNTLSGFYASDKFSYAAFKVILFQILFAIKFMVRHGIVHNDLHGKNGMMRYTKGVSYGGKTLDDYHYFRYSVVDDKSYDVPNIGIIAKVVDLDFACKYSDPQFAPKKVYVKQEDDWNLQFRYSTSYDFLVFIGYAIYYAQIKGVYRDQEACAELTEALAKYVVELVQKNKISIDKRNHMDSGKKYSRMFMDMVSVPSYRPYEKFCHLDLSGILDIPIFEEFGKKESSDAIRILKVAELS